MDGSYKYCRSCPFIQDGEPHPSSGILHRDLIVEDWQRNIVDNGLTYIDPSSVPLLLGLHYDLSCNLKCPSCRSEYHFVSPGTERYQELYEFQEQIKNGLLKVAKTAFLTENGDPFASRIYSSLLASLTPEEYPDLRLTLLTNGQFLTKERYEKLPFKQIDGITISIDAATPKTYAINRPNGSWDKLMRNIAFLGQIRAKGSIKWLVLRFLVQDNNWHEMKKFVRLAEQNNVDTVDFMGIRYLNDNTSPEEYAQQAIWRPEHPRYNKLAEFLQDPIFHNVRKNAKTYVRMIFDLWKVKPNGSTAE